MSTLQTVDFVVSGLDERGQPSSSFVEVAEVGVLDERGRILARFRTAESLIGFLQGASGQFQLVATETVGRARSDLTGKFWCHSGET